MAIEERPATARRPSARPDTRSDRTRSSDLLARLFQPVDIASIAFFRIAFGLTGFFHIWGVLDTQRIQNRYIEPEFLFKYPGLHWLPRVPGEVLLLLYFSMAAACVLIMLGLFYRPAVSYFFVVHTYAIHLDQSLAWNHYYLVSLFAFLMIFIPANRAYSLDVAWRGLPGVNTVPAWALWILRAQMGLTYFFAGLAKLNPDWLSGRPMMSFLAGENSFPFISPLFNEQWFAVLLSWVGAGFDLLIVPLLLWRRTRLFALTAAIGFHLVNSLIFNIEVFPWFGIAATLLFLSPDWPRKIGLWNKDPAPPPAHRAVPEHWFQLRPLQKVGCIVLAVYFVIQFLLPLRHFVYPGNVNWTAEGDLWAWRMLIVEVDAKSVFTAKNKSTGYECVLDPSDYVAKAATGRLGWRPDMMAQFGHRVADVYWKDKHERVSVHVYTKVSVNGHDYAQIVSPDIDLASVERKPHNEWVITEDPPPPPVEPPPLPDCDSE